MAELDHQHQPFHVHNTGSYLLAGYLASASSLFICWVEGGGGGEEAAAKTRLFTVSFLRQQRVAQGMNLK